MRRPSDDRRPPLDLDALKVRLDALVENRPRGADVEADPVSFVRRYAAPRDREVVGLVASSLAFGRVASVRASVGRVLQALGESPADAVVRAGEPELARALDGFVHRVYRGADVARMLAGAGSLLRDHGTLGAAFAHSLRLEGGDLRGGLGRFVYALRGRWQRNAERRGIAHLLPDPLAGSACKRLCLYLRWMVRPDDGVDLGLFSVDPAILLVPVDTHVHRIAVNLGLTMRRDASWRTAEEITGVLRRLDPRDPVRYDFALCHLGVSRDCPSQRDDARCATCVLRPVCLAYRSATGRRGRSSGIKPPTPT